jgi:hypothetical protein
MLHLSLESTFWLSFLLKQSHFRRNMNKKLLNLLFEESLHPVTGIRNNMKNFYMTKRDKILLRKRSVIETINDQFVNKTQVEHSRHRSFGNFITNLVATLITYSYQEKKPSIKFQVQNITQLAMF